MYSQFLDELPEAKALFKGDLQQQQKHFLLMLQEIVRITRSTHLWPVSAHTGTQSIPIIDNLGRTHSCKGVAPEYFDKMKMVLVRCFKEHNPVEFSPAAEEGLGFIFDVVAKASTGTCEISVDAMADKNKLPLKDEKLEPANFTGFFGGVAL